MAGRRARRARDDRRRACSQNFLRSRRLAAELVRDAGVRRDDVVLEIGAGSGMLTDALARCGARVIAVEVDPAWSERLRGRWANVDVVAADALEVALPVEPFRVVANLPFHRTTAMLRHLLDDPSAPLLRADLIVEWGVALKRALVWPTTLLAAYWGAWHAFAIARRLPAASFEPRPSVDAAVLTVVRRVEPLVAIEGASAYHSFLRTGFARGIRAVVPPRRLGSLANALGFHRDAPARDLDVHQWAALFAACHPEEPLSSRATRRPL